MKAEEDLSGSDANLANASCEECALKNWCLLKPVDLQELCRLDEVIDSSIQLKSGGQLFHQDAAVDSLFIVREGAIKTSIWEPDGHDKVVGFYFPGDAVSLETLNCRVYPFSAAALGRTSICQIPIADLDRLARKVPSLQQQLVLAMSEDLLDSRQFSVILRIFSAHERMASFLLWLSATFQRHQLPPTQLSLPMPRRDIANYLGLAIETVSRVLGRMQEEKLIGVSGRDIILLDIEGLKKLSNCCRQYHSEDC